MVRSRANIFRSGPLVLALCAMTVLVACSGGDSDSNSSTSRSGRDARNVSATGGKGAFDIIISGDYRGVGTATVGAASVHISADQVVDENGAVGSLTADGQMTIDSSHFTGSGTVLGKHFSFDGRTDAPDATVKRQSRNGQPAKAEKVVISARVVVTFQTDDNHFGRVVGQRGAAGRTIQ